MRHATALLLSLICLAPTLPADLIPSSQKAVRHEIRVEGLEDFPEYTFLAYPTGVQPPPAGGVDYLHPGQPLDFYKLCYPRVYAVRSPAPELGELTPDWFQRPEVARSEQTLSRISTVEEHSSTSSILTVYRVEGIQDGVVQLVKASEERLQADGTPVNQAAELQSVSPWLLVGLAVVALLLLGVTLLVRRRGATGAG